MTLANGHNAMHCLFLFKLLLCLLSKLMIRPLLSDSKALLSLFLLLLLAKLY